ncbi:MAG: hypothetical protein DRH08_05580 [Deltaproteobacteria bacterium]|nr:MAG: hypothetical protein DRH08_05580 [Deltaproteobacteria bacterium]
MNKDINTLDSILVRLRQTEPTITDDGFTPAVMAQLPCSRKLSAWQKNTILLAATALGSAFVAWQAPITAIPVLLDAATINWPMLLSAAVIAAYGAALATVWTTYSRHW